MVTNVDRIPVKAVPSAVSVNIQLTEWVTSNRKLIPTRTSSQA